MQPKRLITLDARTDAIAERVKRTTMHGFSSWVRTRLLAWDAEKKGGHDPGMEALRAARRTAAYAQTARILAQLLVNQEKVGLVHGQTTWFVDVDAETLVGSTYQDALAQIEERDGVIE